MKGFFYARWWNELELDQAVAPNLQATRESLMKKQLSDQLEKKISTRPERTELVERNIL